MLELNSPGTESSTLQAILKTQYDLADKESQLGALNYLNHVVINSLPPKRFREVGEGWQWALANKVVPAIEHSIGIRKDYTGPMKFWFTLPKGSNKTSFAASLLNFSMAYPTRKIVCYAAAKDREQAGYLKDAMQTEASLNPWLKTRLNFRNFEVDGTHDSILTILAADSKGTAGYLGDIIVIDELTQWEDEEFFNQLMAGIVKRSSTKKVDQCCLIIITNAGYKGDFQWNALNTAKRFIYPRGKWYVYESPVGVRLASWMSEESIKEQCELLPPGMVRQLFNNEWVDPGEDCGLVTREQARACEDPSLSQLTRGQYGKNYIASIDYAPIKDRCVGAIMHREPDGRLIVDHMKVWQGSKERHVPISEVESWLDWGIQNFSLSVLVADPYQLEGTIQRYSTKIQVEVFEARGGKSNYLGATNIRSAIVNKKLFWPPGCGDIILKSGIHSLVDELSEVVVKMMSYGWRIDHEQGKHDDRVVTLMMGATYLLDEKNKKYIPENLELWF